MRAVYARRRRFAGRALCDFRFVEIKVCRRVQINLD
jgi:hypothetical protein